jgi:hypothetical protein
MGRQRVQPQVLQQEARRQRVAVAGGHVVAAAVAHEAGEREAAADLEHARPQHHRMRRHARSQLRAGGPQQAEHRPRRGRDALRGGRARGVGELLAIAQRLDDEIVGTRDGDALQLE